MDLSAHPILNLRSRIDYAFDEFFAGFPWDVVPATFPAADALCELQSPFSPFGPHLDINENEDAFGITVEVPGLNEEDLEIYVSDGVLTISGDKTERRERSDPHYHRAERVFGSFCRRFRLSDEVDWDRIEATVENGVLELRLPKRTRGRKTRSIQIEPK
jgi:HSP20 family protein